MFNSVSITLYDIVLYCIIFYCILAYLTASLKYIFLLWCSLYSLHSQLSVYWIFNLARLCIPGAEGNSKVGLFEKDWARDPGEMGEGEGIWAWCTDNNWGKHKVSVCYHKERLSILFPDSVKPLSHTWPRNGSICSCKTVCGEGNSHRLPYSGMSDQFLQVYFFQLISSWCNYKHLLLLIGYSRICNVVFCCLWGKRNKPCKCGWSFKLKSCAVIQGEPLTLLVALCYFPVHGTLLRKIDQIWNPFALNYIFWLAVFFFLSAKTSTLSPSPTLTWMADCTSATRSACQNAR